MIYLFGKLDAKDFTVLDECLRKHNNIMKRQFIFIGFLFLALNCCGQRNEIKTDIFGTLEYISNDRNYSAYLKEDIFQNLIFSDNNKNEIILEKKYLDKYFKGMRADKEKKKDFFYDQVGMHRHKEGYKARFSIDIFDAEIIEDNKGNKVEKKKDIFGNSIYKEASAGKDIVIERAVNGGFKFKDGSLSASLEKSIFDKWHYEDSSGNDFEFSSITWSKLTARHKNNEGIFFYLLSAFLNYR